MGVAIGIQPSFFGADELECLYATVKCRLLDDLLNLISFF